MSEDLEDEALALFKGLQAEFPSLRIAIDTNDPNVEISVELPRQPGLDFDVHLNFQNGDELHLGAGEMLWCSWFPSSDPEVVEKYRAAVVGVISGRNRIVEYRRWGRAVGADLQAPVANGWRTVACSRRGLLPFRWGATTQVLQNRCRSTTG